MSRIVFMALLFTLMTLETKLVFAASSCEFAVMQSLEVNRTIADFARLLLKIEREKASGENSLARGTLEGDYEKKKAEFIKSMDGLISERQLKNWIRSEIRRIQLLEDRVQSPKEDKTSDRRLVEDLFDRIFPVQVEEYPNSFAASFAPDSKSFYITPFDGNTLKKVDLSSRVATPVFEMPKSHVSNVQVRPNGDLLLKTLSGEPYLLRMSDMGSSSFIGQTTEASTDIFSFDGKEIYRSDVQFLKILDAETGELKRKVQLKDHVITHAFAFGRDRIYVASRGSRGSHINVLDPKKGRPISRFRIESPKFTSFSPAGKLLFSNSTYGGVMYEMPQGSVVEIPSFKNTFVLRAAEFTGDGKYFVTANIVGELQVYSTETWEQQGETLDVGPEVIGLSMSPDGRYVLVRAQGTTLKLIDLYRYRRELRVK